MNTLYIDTHSNSIIIALFKNDKIISLKEEKEHHDHSTVCMPTIVKLLEENALKIENIDDIVVVIGPGSFTGVRIGVTIAKTLAYTLNIPIRTLTSLEIYLPVEEAKGYLFMPEKNGFYIAELEENKKEISKYEYITKEEFLKLKNENKIIEKTSIDYEKIIEYVHKKKTQNPHQVNPFYVKKIEVEK